MQKYCLKIFIQSVMVITLVLPLSAQENSRNKFELNGHEFLSTTAVKSAGIETVLFSKLSMGSTGTLVSKGILVGDTEILGFTGSLLYAGGAISYKQKVNNWFAMYLELKYLGSLGTQFPTLLAEGVNTVEGSEIGWLFRLYEGNKGYLSGTVFTTRYKGSVLDLVGFIEDVLDSVPGAKVVNKVPVLILGTRLNYAHAFNKTWGLQFDSAIGYGEELHNIKKSVMMDIGLFVEANLYPEKKIPLGFGIGYNLTSMPETALEKKRYANIFYLNAAYTKASDFEIGLEIHYFEVPLSNYTTRPHIFSPSLIMRFNF